MVKWIKKSCRAIAYYLNEMAGVPNYNRYLDHLKKHHPDQPPMTRAEFYRQAIDERYGSGDIRRCC
jgi:uncharacterized short protein YbdD (DUF466 family)